MGRKRGTEFKGIAAGANYDRFASLSGFGPSLYRRAAAELPLWRGMRVLDLGCGTALFGIAVAELIEDGLEIHGVDLSEKQLEHGRRKTRDSSSRFYFRRCSMHELPYDDCAFDAAITSLALHAVPPEVRQGAIRETGRVLKPGGIFGLVDWSKPHFGLWGALWLPMLLRERKGDNWLNTYPRLCLEVSLQLERDVYLNSLVRCQVFRKAQGARYASHRGGVESDGS